VTPRWLAVAAAVALTGCGSQPPASSSASSRASGTAAESSTATAATPAVHIAHRPPTSKDVIDAAIASAAVPLSVSSTCAKVGTEPSDATIGRYLAGFFAELSSPDKKNWIETHVEPGRSNGGEPVSICTLTIRHEDGDDRWGWGVRFEVRSSDGLVLQNSFTCTGSG
jgi:hypothetical protein